MQADLLGQLTQQKWFAGTALSLVLGMGSLNLWFIQKSVNAMENNTSRLIRAVDANTRQNYELTSDVRVLQSQVRIILGDRPRKKGRFSPSNDEES
jgi:hypothetical protein